MKIQDLLKIGGIEPFEGDWKDSLIERKRNDGKLI